MSKVKIRKETRSDLLFVCSAYGQKMTFTTDRTVQLYFDTYLKRYRCILSMYRKIEDFSLNFMVFEQKIT
jgi:hypothetical protein